MIFRLSDKVNTKIRAGALATLPLDENPFADWSSGLFFVGRSPFILLTNTKSLYATVLPGKGITDEKTSLSVPWAASESSWPLTGRRASTNDWSPLSADRFNSPRR
jgi:hypothetical protein